MKLVLCGALFSFTAVFADAQSITNTWTFDGGGLAPATYSGNFRPTTLQSDQGGTLSSINVTWVPVQSGGPGGIGSSNFPEGYGGMYSFPSGLALTLTNSQPLVGMDRLDFTFWAGGNGLSYSQNSLTLNYNVGNTSVAGSSFNAGTPVSVQTPIGAQTLTPYAWSWTGLSLLGSSDRFSISWNAPAQHSFFTDVNVTQAVPEPSVFSLLFFAAAGLSFWLRTRGTA